jgi:nickel-dependent lactate racemase
MTLTWQEVTTSRVEWPEDEASLLDAAVGTLSLDGARRVALVVNDPARATRTRATLAALARVHGAALARVTLHVIVATGTHRFGEVERRAFERDTLGDELAWSRIEWHDAGGELAPVGPFRFCRALLEAEHVLGVGSVEPHYFAGATGAHKTLTIGVASRDDIERNHEGALHPASDVLRLTDNPVHLGIERMVGELEQRARVSSVSHVAHEGRAVAAWAGEPVATTVRLLPVARAVFAREVDEPVDVLHLRVPSPLGRSVYQADKALKNNHLAVRDGGAVILEAACEEGLGMADFVELLDEAPSLAAALARVRARGYRLGDHKAVKLRALMDPACRGVTVVLVSRALEASAAARLGMRLAASVDDATAQLAELGLAKGTGLVVDDAGHATTTPKPRTSSPGSE